MDAREYGQWSVLLGCWRCLCSEDFFGAQQFLSVLRVSCQQEEILADRTVAIYIYISSTVVVKLLKKWCTKRPLAKSLKTEH